MTRLECRSFIREIGTVLMDNSHYRLTFDPDNNNKIPGKSLFKVAIDRCCNVWKI